MSPSLIALVYFLLATASLRCSHFHLSPDVQPRRLTQGKTSATRLY